MSSATAVAAAGRVVSWLPKIALFLLSCQGVPSTPGRDAAVEGAPADLAAGQITLRLDRSFGEEGELPLHLLLTAAERLLAVTDAAIYQLDRDGRVLGREALPATAGGSVALLTSAVWDGTGLGATVRWGHDPALAAGSYLALADAAGAFAPAAMIALGPAASEARTAWDPAAGRHLVLVAETQGSGRALSLHSVARGGGTPAVSALVGGLAPGTSVGGWVGPARAPALCAVEPPGKIRLRLFPQGQAPVLVELTDAGRTAVGPCLLATSGQTRLVAWVQQALPVTEVDAGADIGAESLASDVPLVRLVDPSGQAGAGSVRLTEYGETALTEAALWDGRRYLVLVRTSYRGGRLALAVLDESGLLLARDLELPLSYEPGKLLGARLALDPTGDLWLLYATRRPADEGVLHLARLALHLE